MTDPDIPPELSSMFARTAAAHERLRAEEEAKAPKEPTWDEVAAASVEGSPTDVPGDQTTTDTTRAEAGIGYKPKRSLNDYVKLYNLDPDLGALNPHPWIKYVRAIPMGGGRPSMNHSLEVLNMIAIHLERLGFTEPSTTLAEIKYVDPEHGPKVDYNPGTWVDIDAVVPTATAVTAPSLEGVPDENFALLEEAIRNEKIRRLKVANADPEAKLDALAQEQTSTIEDAVIAVSAEEPTS